MHYNRDGQITFSVAYQNGLQHGKILYYDSYDLRISKDLNYVNGQLNRLQVGFYRENEKRDYKKNVEHVYYKKDNIRTESILLKTEIVAEIFT